MARKLKVYLSYVREDFNTASKLFQWLTKYDWISPWMDTLEAARRQSWEDTNQRALSESDAVILCLSQISVRQEGYIQVEYKKIVGLAEEKPEGTIFVIPVTLDECEIPFLFRSYQSVSYSNPKNANERIIRSLEVRAKQLNISLSQSNTSSAKQAKQEQTYIEATRVSPQSPATWENLGNLYYQQKRYDEAIAAFKTALEVGDKDVNTWINLGNAYYYLGDYPAADGTYRQAIELEPQSSIAWIGLGNVNIAIKDFEAAQMFFQKAIELNPSSAVAYASLGGLYASLGIIDKAISAYQKAIELDPTSNQHQTNLKNLLSESTNKTNEGKIGDSAGENTPIEAIETNQVKQTTDAGGNNAPSNTNTVTSSEQHPEPPTSLPQTVIRSYSIVDEALEKHAASDKPIQDVKQDKLGFATYVNALHDFIISKDTTTPLTIAIDGQWGSGKSSLMSMLKNRLEPQRSLLTWLGRQGAWWRWFFWQLLAWPTRLGGGLFAGLFGKSKRLAALVNDIRQGLPTSPDALAQADANALPKRLRFWATVRAKCEPMEPPSHPTVWLNAWKFDNQEEVWASLALATMEQIKQKHGLLWRLRFWRKLTFSRFSFWPGLWQFVKQFLLPLTFAGVAAYYDVIMGSFDVQLDAFAQYGSPLLWAGAAISGILSVSSIFKDPFQISLEKIFDRPNYKEKVHFLTHFEKDFAKIVRSATQNGWGWKRSKLIIFIDDLDRCEPPKAADVIEAINLFLDAEGCVFVVGMDSDAVAMSVEVKYKNLFERMKTENGGVVSLGRAFLEKIVQIPFSMPRPTSGQIMSMVDDTLGSGMLLPEFINSGVGSGFSGAPVVDETGNVVAIYQDQSTITQPVIPKNDPASYARNDVRQAIRLGVGLLSENPRQVKTFINLFRLSIYIANERKILEERQIGDKFSGIGLNRLAIWVACSVRWQSLVRHLYADTQVDSLCTFLAEVTQTIKPEYTWTTGHKNVPDEIKKKLANLRKNEKGSEAHWCHLPWDWWLLEPDFLRVLKLLEDLWSPVADGESHELKVLLNMSRPLSAPSGVAGK